MLTCLCPNCGSKLVYGKGDKTVTCFACDSSMSIEELTGNSGASMAASAGMSTSFVGGFTPAMAMIGFDNPESGVVFIENFFDTYNWAAYAVSSEIAIPEIAEVIANNKMKNGASPLSWYLDYKGLAFPLRKKIEGLAVHQQLIAEKYNPIDSSEAFTAFDSYRRICKALKDEKTAIFKQLEADIKYAEKFALDSAKLAEIKNDFSDLKSLFDKNVQIVKEINDVPAYAEAKAAAKRKKAAELAQAGIDAEATYQKALEIYNSTNLNKSSALKLFESIRGYGDSVEYIEKINQYFNFNDKMYRFFGKHFIYKEEDYAPTLDLKSLGKKALKKAKATEGEDDSAKETKALSLYEVVDGVPAGEALVKGIDQIIDCYGSRFYYFKVNEGIYCFDIYKKEETIVDTGKTTDYKNDASKYEFGYGKSGSTFYVKKKVPAAAALTGCMANLKKKKQSDDPVLNPYCVILVDMSTNSCRTIISQFLEIAQHHEDKLFYKFAYKPEKAKSGCLQPKAAEPETKTRLMVCDVAKGTSKQVLDEDCEIHTVHKDYIIYSLWKPNRFNRDLHVYDLENSKDTVIEANIFNFFDVIDNKLYYTVGNEDYCPLVRSDFNGENREEIMANVENIVGDRGGWMYVQKGRGRNSVLVKVSSDGKHRQILCTQFKSLCRFEGSSVYYVDTYNTLRVVRIDGKENRKLAENVTKVFPSDTGLFYVRDERVGESRHDTALSLYKMDKEGRNVRKIVFNVDYVQNDPKTNSLYYSKAENMRFKVYEEGKEDKATYEFHNIEKFSRMDKDTGISELVLTLGLPSSDGPETGCLKKKKKHIIYQEAPIRQTYASKGLVAEDEEEETLVDEPTAPNYLPAGCASILSAGKSLTKGKSGSTPKAASANKGKSSSNVKLKLPKVSPTNILLGLFAVSLLIVGINAFLMPRIENFYYPEVFLEIILPILIGLVLAALALILIGIIPLNIGPLKKNVKLGGIYILVALIFLVSGALGIFQLPGKGDLPGKAITMTLNDTEEVSIPSDGEQYYKFTPSKTGLYNFTAENNSVSCDIDCTLYTHWSDDYAGSSFKSFSLSSGYSYSSSESNVYAVELTANTTYLIKLKYEYSYYNGSFDFKVSEHPRLNATALTLGEPVTVSLPESGDEVWFSFVYDDGIYGSTASYPFEFTHDAECNISSKLYKGGSESTTTSSSSSQWKYDYFENCTTYYLSLSVDGYDGDDEFTLAVDWPEDGTSARTAYTAAVENAASGITNISIPYNAPVWYKYKATASGVSTISASASNSITLTAYTASEALSLAKEMGNHAEGTAPSLTMQMTAGETYYFELSHDGYSSISGVTLKIGIPENGETVETAITVAEASEITSSATTAWYKFTPSIDGNHVLSLSPADDVTLELYLSKPEDGDTADLTLSGAELPYEWSASTSSTYYVKVSASEEYTLKVEHARDGLRWNTAYVAEKNTAHPGSVSYANNVWYEYTATMSGDHTITATSTYSTYLFGYTESNASNAHTGTGSSSSANYSSNRTTHSFTWYLMEGQTYYIRIYGYNSADYVLTVNLPENGLSADTAYKTTLNTTKTQSTANSHVWYKFTPTVDGTYYAVSNTGSYSSTLYGYTDPTAANADKTSSSDGTIKWEMTANTTYYFKLAFDSAYISTSFIISEAGDTYATAYEATAEVQSTGHVNSSQNKWYKYTALVSGSHTIAMTSTSSIRLYGYTSSNVAYASSGSSNSYASIYTSSSTTSYNNTWNLTAGETYYFRLYGYNSADYTFTVSLPQDGTSALTGYKAVPDTKYTNSLSNSTIWYKYTAVVDGEHTIATTSDYSMDLYLYDTTTGSAIDSEDGTSNEMTYTMEKDKTYYFKLSYTSYSTNYYTFKITAPQDGTSRVTGYVLEADGDALTGTVDSTTTEVWYKFTPEVSGYYTLNVIADNNVYLYKYDSATATSYSDYTSGYNISYSSWSLTAGTTYYFKVEQYSSYESDYSFSIAYPENGSTYQTAYKVKGQSSTSYAYWSTNVSTSSSSAQWYKLTAPVAGTYTFELDSSSTSSYYRKYFNGYSNPTGSYDNGSSSYVTDYSFTKTLQKGEVYYVKISRYNSSSTSSSTFRVYGPGTNYNDAVTLSYGTEQEISIPAGGYVWLKYTPSSYYSGDTHYVQVNGTSNTQTYVYSGTSSSSSSNSGTSYNVSYNMSSSYTYYIMVYSQYGATVTVSVSTSY